MEALKQYGKGVLYMVLIASVAYQWGYWNERGRIHALTARKAVSV